MATDASWLPQLAPHLPVRVPVPVAVGRPGGDYPWPWTIVPWLDGRNPEAGQDLADLAVDLAGFVRAMIAIDPMGGRSRRGSSGGLGRGDPAVEVRPGWSLFDARARAAYREALGFDEATWVRGWAWMLSGSLYWLADLWDSISEEDRKDTIGHIGYILRHRHD